MRYYIKNINTPASKLNKEVKIILDQHEQEARRISKSAPSNFESPQQTDRQIRDSLIELAEEIDMQQRSLEQGNEGFQVRERNFIRKVFDKIDDLIDGAIRQRLTPEKYLLTIRKISSVWSHTETERAKLFGEQTDAQTAQHISQIQGKNRNQTSNNLNKVNVGIPPKNTRRGPVTFNEGNPSLNKNRGEYDLEKEIMLHIQQNKVPDWVELQSDLYVETNEIITGKYAEYVKQLNNLINNIKKINKNSDKKEMAAINLSAYNFEDGLLKYLREISSQIEIISESFSHLTKLMVNDKINDIEYALKTANKINGILDIQPIILDEISVMVFSFMENSPINNKNFNTRIKQYTQLLEKLNEFKMYMLQLEALNEELNNDADSIFHERS